MKNKEKLSKPHLFERFASWVTRAAGSTTAFILAIVLVLAWLFTGPLFHYSQTWQLVINTGTTIITFLMVFLIQKSQNKDSLAIQLKLNELVAAHELASNRLVDVENMTEDELRVIQKYYGKLRTKIKDEENLQSAHSIEELEEKTDGVEKSIAHEIGKEIEKKAKQKKK